MFSPRRTLMQTIHLYMASDVWSALREYSESVGEPSLSQAARRLLKERLTALGFLKEKT